MTPLDWLLFVLAVIALIAGVAAWSSHVSHADTLNRLGRRYGVERWPGESLKDFEQRIRNRILVKGWRN